MLVLYISNYVVIFKGAVVNDRIDNELQLLGDVLQLQVGTYYVVIFKGAVVNYRIDIELQLGDVLQLQVGTYYIVPSQRSIKFDISIEESDAGTILVGVRILMPWTF